LNDRESTSSSIISAPLTAWRDASRIHQLLVWSAVAALGVLGGVSLVADPRVAKGLLLLPFLILALTIDPPKLFVAWLFGAPLVQGAANGTRQGHAFYVYIFLVPPLILLARMAMGSVQIPRFWAIDALPALYVGYILVRLKLFPSALTASDHSSVRSVYIAVGLPIIAYYLVAFGKATGRFPQTVAASFLWGALLVAVLALVEAATGWNLWHNVIGGGRQIRRVASTFEGPAPMATYLGAGVAFAVAILVWKGPRSLRLPAILLIGTSIPALYVTYTRGPIVAVAAVVLAMALVANRARWPSLLVVVAVGALLFASWDQISSSTIYKDRLGVTRTVTPRVVLTQVSLNLFEQRPLFGWGYATFDQAKLTVPTGDRLTVETTTSHNTFLTILAELGVTGLALLLVPWFVVGRRAVAASWNQSVEPWIVGGCVGAAAVFVLAVSTYDGRFFPFDTALPWITLGLVRNVLARGEASVASALTSRRLGA
jgi:O-antigen ligase